VQDIIPARRRHPRTIDNTVEDKRRDMEKVYHPAR